MDWSARDVICFASPRPLPGAAADEGDGHASGGGGHSGWVHLLQPSKPWEVVGLHGHDHDVAAVRWGYSGDALLTVDSCGGYVLHCNRSLPCWDSEAEASLDGPQVLRVGAARGGG